MITDSRGQCIRLSIEFDFQSPSEPSAESVLFQGECMSKSAVLIAAALCGTIAAGVVPAAAQEARPRIIAFGAIRTTTSSGAGRRPSGGSGTR